MGPSFAVGIVAGASRSRPVRAWWVLAHRWVGLILVLFLVVAGLTGALLAWTEPLERLVTPGLFAVPTHAAETAPKSPLALVDAVAAAYPHAQVVSIDLAAKPGWTTEFFLVPKPGGKPLAADEVFVDPVTGQVAGDRRWGAISQGLKNLIPFLYRLHYSLALGVVGTYAFGIAALAWTLDCFVGAYLTLPIKTAKSQFLSGDWRRRWRPAWSLRWRSGGYKLNFDLHRAGGLWLWALLFVFAWSAVDLNLHQVYDPVTRTLFGYTRVYDQLPDRPGAAQPALSWSEAYRTAHTIMVDETAKRGAVIRHDTRLGYDPAKRVYMYRAATTRDVSLSGGSVVYIDADTGRMAAFDMPSTGKPGDVITTWLESLHMADAFGWPYQVVVSLTGLAIAGLSVTGVVIWRRKAQARSGRGKKSTITLAHERTAR